MSDQMNITIQRVKILSLQQIRDMIDIASAVWDSPSDVNCYLASPSHSLFIAVNYGKDEEAYCGSCGSLKQIVTDEGKCQLPRVYGYAFFNSDSVAQDGVLHYELDDITIHPEYEGIGIGTSLLRSSIINLYHNNFNTPLNIGLTVMYDNEQALALYEKLGFKRVAVYDHYYDLNEHGVRYMMEVDDAQIATLLADRSQDNK